MRFFNLKTMTYTDFIAPEFDTELEDIIRQTFNMGRILANIEIKETDGVLDRYFPDENQKILMTLINGSTNALGRDAYKRLELNPAFMEWFNNMFIGWDEDDIFDIFCNIVNEQVFEENTPNFLGEAANLNLV